MAENLSPEIIYVGKGDPNQGRIADSEVAHEHANYLKKRATVQHRGVRKVAKKFGEDKIEIARSAEKVFSERSIKNLEERVDRDTLTGLYSRHYYETAIVRELARVKRSTGILGLVVADVRALKAINDTYGHDVGDTALASIGSALINNTNLRTTDSVCRVGGDEIRAIIPDVKPFKDINGDTQAKDGLVVVALRMQQAVDQKRTEIATGETLALRLDIGVALAAFNDNEATFFRRADKASYLAKRLIDGKEQGVVVASLGKDGEDIFEIAHRKVKTNVIQYTPILKAPDILKSMK